MFEVMVTSSILIAALILLRYLLRNKISRCLQYALWLLVALRLLAPVTVFQNPLNVLNVLQASADGEKYSEQGADGNWRVVYRVESTDGNQGVAHNGEQVDGRAESGQSNSGLTAEEIAGQQEQGMNAFAGDRELMGNRGELENQRGQKIWEGLGNQIGQENRGKLGNQIGQENRGKLGNQIGQENQGKLGNQIRQENWGESENQGEQESQGTSENQRAAENQGRTGIQEALGTEENILSMKEIEYLLEGGSWLNRFFIRGWRYTWYLGMAVLGAWMLGCNLLFRRRISGKRTFLGREGGLKVYMVDGIGAPCLFGILHPAIYLTREAACNPRHREYTVLHELTHYRHKDHIWTFVRSLCLVIYWFDPLVWLAVCLSASDCEMACDESVTRRIGEEHSREYGYTLIEMAAVSGRKPGMLRFATGFSVRKKELKERISRIAGGRKRMGILVTGLVMACGIVLAACTFGGAAEEIPMGRYVETEVELPAVGGTYSGLVQEGDKIRIHRFRENDLLSEDGGENFAEDEIPEKYRKWKNWIINTMISPGGARVFEVTEASKLSNTRHYLVTENEQETELTGIELERLGAVCYGGGYFYCEAGETYRINRVDPVTGDVHFLLEGYYPYYGMAASDKMLYLQCYDRLRLYDLEKEELVVQQDEVLDGFIKEKLQAGTIGWEHSCLYPYKDGLYILTKDGLYWHTLYGDSVELIIDGATCSMCNPDRELLGMAIVEKEGNPDFLVLSSDGSLARYSYDAALPAEPEISLRVYSLYEDGNVRRLVGAFRQAHPELYVRYETGTGLEYGATYEDALKNLATEIAAGKGPDIIVADELPLRSYVEKGIFMDLSEFREGMTETDYFLKVIDGIKYEDKLYTIPLSFAIPVIGGSGEKLAGVETLSDLADLLEKERLDGTEGSLIGVWSADDMLRLLAQSGQGTWMEDDSTLDREAVTEFLLQAKWIYDAQMKDQEEYAWGNDATWAAGGSALDRQFSTWGINPARSAAHFAAGHGQPYFGGFIGSNEADFPYWCATLDYIGADYTLMPGQQYGFCLAESLLAVNQASGHREKAMLFLEYALSAEGQQSAGMNGVPVNREAYMAGWKDPRGEGYENIIYSGWMIDDGDGDFDDDIFLEIYWPGEETFRKLDDLISRVTGVGYCDNRVYNTVVEAGQAFLDGRNTLEEVLGEIESKVKLYLAE